MWENPVELVGRNPAWRTVLDAYRTAELERRSPDGPPDRWTARIREMADLERPHLSQIHGRLIAHGLLRFQLAGAGIAAGLEYQLSPLGKRALDGDPPAGDDPWSDAPGLERAEQD